MIIVNNKNITKLDQNREYASLKKTDIQNCWYFFLARNGKWKNQRYAFLLPKYDYLFHCWYIQININKPKHNNIIHKTGFYKTVLNEMHSQAWFYKLVLNSWCGRYFVTRLFVICVVLLIVWGQIMATYVIDSLFRNALLWPLSLTRMLAF